MKLITVLCVTIALAAGAPVEESKIKETHGLAEIGHKFGYEEPLLYDDHDSWTDNILTVHTDVAAPYPVSSEKHVPETVMAPVPVHIAKHVQFLVEQKVPTKKKVYLAVDHHVPYTVKVKVPVYHKQVVELAKPYPVHVEKSYVEQPYQIFANGLNCYHKPYLG